MYGKCGTTMCALAAIAMTCGMARAQEGQAERQKSQQRDPAAAGAEQVGAQPRNETRASAAAEGRQAQSSQQIDQAVAECLALGNFGEIQLGQLASQKTENPEVKAFAQKMTQEHSQYLKKLQPWVPAAQYEDLQRSENKAPGAARTSANARANEERNAEGRDASDNAEPRREEAAPKEPVRQPQPGAAARTGRQPQPNATAAGRQSEQASNPMMQIQREASQRCLQLTREMLEEKQGADFDKCYIGQQIGAHIEMLAKLEAAENHVSPEFREVVAEGKQATEHHLKEVRAIAESLADGQANAQPNREAVNP